MPKIRQRRTKSNSGIMSLLGPELTDKEFVMLTVQGYIETYSKKYKLTTWNAYMRLTEEKAFKQLMIRWFRNKRDSAKKYKQKLNTFLNSKEKLRSFYKNNIKRGNALAKKLATTNPKYFTRRKKR
jgi:hypothetical protein